MTKALITLTVVLLSAVMGSAATAAEHNEAQRQESVAPTRETTPKRQIQDYAPAEIRKARGVMFDSGGPALDAEPAPPKSNRTVSSSSAWEVPIPACKSDFIFIGQVSDWQTFFSNDHSEVYSELYIDALETYKTTSGISVIRPAGHDFVGLVPNGTMELPSLRLVQTNTSKPGTLQPKIFDPNAAYLFFAVFDPTTATVFCYKIWRFENWSIDGRNATVVPMDVEDQLEAEKGKSPYAGKPASVLLQDLTTALASCGAKN